MTEYNHSIELENEEYCITFETNNEELYKKILYTLGSETKEWVI